MKECSAILVRRALNKLSSKSLNVSEREFQSLEDGCATLRARYAHKGILAQVGTLVTDVDLLKIEAIN